MTGKDCIQTEISTIHFCHKIDRICQYGRLKLAPIYDNGYSLLYDDIKGMLGDFKAATKHCLCNAPLYQENFKLAERIFMNYSKIYEPTISLDIERDIVEMAVYQTRDIYTNLEREIINNIPIKPIWWDKVVDFIMWRIENVRNLRDNMEE